MAPAVVASRFALGEAKAVNVFSQVRGSGMPMRGPCVLKRGPSMPVPCPDFATGVALACPGVVLVCIGLPLVWHWHAQACHWCGTGTPWLGWAGIQAKPSARKGVGMFHCSTTRADLPSRVTESTHFKDPHQRVDPLTHDGMSWRALVCPDVAMAYHWNAALACRWRSTSVLRPSSPPQATARSAGL